MGYALYDVYGCDHIVVEIHVFFILVLFLFLPSTRTLTRPVTTPFVLDGSINCASSRASFRNCARSPNATRLPRPRPYSGLLLRAGTFRLSQTRTTGQRARVQYRWRVW